MSCALACMRHVSAHSQAVIRHVHSKSHEGKCSEVELADILMLSLFIWEVQKYKQDYLPISVCHFNNSSLLLYLSNVGL
jgi:hypothetical protein